MRTAIAASVLSLLSLTVALPEPKANWGPWNGGPYPHGPCLSSSAAQALVTGYTYLLQSPGGPDFNSTANAILDNSFQVFSDSIQTLQGAPLGVPSYTSKAYFLVAQFQTPPLPVVQTLDYFYTCNKIGWRWNATGLGAQEVKGMIDIDVDFNGPSTVNGGALIQTVYSEFNTAVFLQDLGVTACKPPARS